MPSQLAANGEKPTKNFQGEGWELSLAVVTIRGRVASLRGGEHVVALTKKELIALGLAILALTYMSENMVVV
jgi:hypothetical protein